MVPLVHAGLVDIRRPHEGTGIRLEDQDLLPVPGAEQRGVQAVQPGTDDDPVITPDLHADPPVFSFSGTKLQLKSLP